MNLIYFLRLIRRHIVLIIFIPLAMGLLTILLTSKPSFTYTSQTTLFTGLATGSSVEMDKSFNYFLTNTAFDNLLNIINSRETQQEVAIRLLAQHLLLQQPDTKFIGPKAFAELREITPPQVLSFVSKTGKALSAKDSAFIKGNEYYTRLFPSYINPIDYELTVRNLTDLMKSSDTNFVYKLLNYEHPRYSLRALSAIKAQRVANSDLIKITYEVDDPGICQQTLALLNQVCMKNYKGIRENRSDEVVKYFENQLQEANAKLKTSEDKLLAFNRNNNIINYYEQSKAVAEVKEEMEVDYNNKKAQLSGLEATIKKLEEKLNIQQSVQLKSGTMLEKKAQLGEINYAIANAEAEEQTNEESRLKLPELKRKAETLRLEIKRSVEELYSYQNTIDGLPVNNLLNEWLRNLMEAENLRAKLRVMDQRNKEFQQQYAIYAPAGANIKRIEREISVSEQGYLEILHGLNLAKLKLQDSEISSELKLIDPPYFPLSPVPTKRKILIVLATLLGGILVLGIIILTDYFDNTIKNSKRASDVLQLSGLGMIPKIYLQPGVLNFANMQDRLIQMIAKNLNTSLDADQYAKQPKLILLVSNQEKEGKTVIGGNLAKSLIQKGKTVCYLNVAGKYHPYENKKQVSILRKLFGYQDPRIDFESPFLADPVQYLPAHAYSQQQYNEQTINHKSYQPLLHQLQWTQDARPDFLFVELPALINHDFPVELTAAADFIILVCRANREWTEADQTALSAIRTVTNNNIKHIINGTEIQEIETLLGELPKKRSALRMKLKNALRFQYYSKNNL